MKRALLAIAITVCATTLSGGQAGAFKRVSVGERLEDFRLESFSGQTVRLSESLGEEATVVVFWAAWSPRSVEALADFQALFEEHGPRRLQVIGVNVEHQEWDPSEARKIVAVIEQVGPTYPTVIDENLAVFDEYGIVAVPSAILADKYGTVVELLAGYSQMTRSAFQETVLETLGVLKTEPPPQNSSSSVYVPKGKAARYFQMGKMLLKKRKTSRAITTLSRAIAEDPNYLDAYQLLAGALRSMGRDDEARRIQTQIDSMTGQDGASEKAKEDPDIAITDRAAKGELEKVILNGSTGQSQ